MPVSLVVTRNAPTAVIYSANSSDATFSPVAVTDMTSPFYEFVTVTDAYGNAIPVDPTVDTLYFGSSLATTINTIPNTATDPSYDTTDGTGRVVLARTVDRHGGDLRHASHVRRHRSHDAVHHHHIGARLPA